MTDFISLDMLTVDEGYALIDSFMEKHFAIRYGSLWRANITSFGLDSGRLFV